MKIILSPIADTIDTVISINGLIIDVNGISYDLSVIPEGGQAEADEDSPFIGIVTRNEVTIKYYYNSLLSEQNQSTNWEDYTFDIVSGNVPDPIIRIAQ
jgi:hypothetical protein